MSFSHTYPVGVRETDPSGCCRPSGLLGFLQDAAMQDTNQMGIGAPSLMQLCGGHWILARLRCTLTRPLAEGTQLHLTTAHRGMKGALIYRDVTGADETGPVLSAVSAWVVGDPVSRKMLWPASLPEVLRCSGGEGPTLKKLRLPDTLEPVYDRLVRYSDADENGHMNNSRYADLCCDALPMEELRDCWVQELELNYEKECLQGQTVTIYLARDGLTRYFRGELEGETCFQARMLLARRG